MPGGKNAIIEKIIRYNTGKAIKSSSSSLGVLTFETIAYHVWGEEYIDVTPKTIHNLLSRLRQKLQIAPEEPEYVISVRGVGYKFDIPHTEK